jgi:hypothetical protein
MGLDSEGQKIALERIVSPARLSESLGAANKIRRWSGRKGKTSSESSAGGKRESTGSALFLRRRQFSQPVGVNRQPP